MSYKIKYKIISYSSEEPEYPVSSVQVPGSDGWQSKRFCNYPQEITLEFYGVVQITKIEILVDSKKIPTTADILYYDPTEPGDSRFSKYGSLEFSRNQSGRILEQKTVMVDMRCLYLRLLLHRPFKNKENFFSQVGVHQIAIYGLQTNITLMPMETGKGDGSQTAEQKLITEEEDQFIYSKLLQIQAQKEKAILEQDYDEAQRMKQIMLNIKRLSYIIRDLKAEKQAAIERQDFDEAKKIKSGIDRTKRDIQQLLSEDPIEERQPNRQQEFVQSPVMDHDTQDNEFVGIQINKMLHKQEISESRVSKQSVKNSRAKKYGHNLKKSNVTNYEDRPIPTLDKKNKQFDTELEQEAEQRSRVKLEAEEVDGKYISDAQLMQPFYEQVTIRKFFSKHWQLKEQALIEIQQMLTKSKQDPNLIKCLLRIIAYSLSQTNFRVSLQALNLLDETIKVNETIHKVSKNAELQNDLTKILVEIIRKMSDNNAKTKNSAKSTFNKMVESNLYGVEACCSALMKTIKSNVKLSNKQEIQRLRFLGNIVLTHGMGHNAVPYSVIDYGVEKLSNPCAEVRSEAVTLLAKCSNRDEQKTMEKLQLTKHIYIQQVQARRNQLNGSKSHAKK